MKRNLLITDTKGFIATNLEGMYQCDQKRGRWYASEFSLNTDSNNTEPKIDFLYKHKKESYTLKTLCSKHNFFQYVDTLEEAEKLCRSKNNVIAGQQEDELMIHGRLW